MDLIKDIQDRLFSRAEVGFLGLGDSLTYGWEVSMGFFDRFIHGLRGSHPTSVIRSINGGVPGDTAQGGLGRLTGLLPENPDVAVVQFGLNDYFASIDVDSFAQSLASIVGRLHESGVVAILVTSCSVAHLDRRSVTSINAYYQAVSLVAKETQAISVALHEYWDNQVGVDASLFGADGIHPTDRGHQLMADGLLRLFDSA